jgi:hypothetical protein
MSTPAAVSVRGRVSTVHVAEVSVDDRARVLLTGDLLDVAEVAASADAPLLRVAFFCSVQKDAQGASTALSLMHAVCNEFHLRFD